MSSRLASPSFSVQDLGALGGEIVEAAARDGVARLEDTDGAFLVVFSQDRFEVVSAIANWATQYLLLDAAARKPAADRSAADFGECPWLQAFDDEDLRTFLEELAASLLATAHAQSTSELERLLEAWQVTAEVAGDPEAREVLLGPHDPADFVEVDRPE